MEHRSREKRQPTGKSVYPTPLTARWLRHFEDHVYIDTNTIIALAAADASASTVKGGLEDHFHEIALRGRGLEPWGHLLNRPEEQYLHGNKRYRPVIHAISEAGIAFLRSHGYEPLVPHKRSSSYLHTILEDRIVTSLKIEIAKSPEHNFITPEDIYAAAPAATRALPYPFSLDLTIDVPVLQPANDREPAHVEMEPLNTTLTPDWRGPFAIRFNGKRLNFSLEADNETERGRTRKFVGVRSMTKIFKQWFAVYEPNPPLYNTDWGLKNMMLLMVFNNATRMKHAMEILSELTDGKGNKYMLFKSIDSFADYWNAPKPEPALFNQPWQRVGHPMFSIKDFTEVA